MKTYLLYGLWLAIAGFLLNLILFVCGLQSEAAKFQLGQTIGFVAGVAIAIVLIVLAIKARRSAVPATEAFTYGNAFGAGFCTQCWGSLFGIASIYLYTAVINPHLSDLIVQIQMDKLQARGLSGDQADRAEHMMRMFSGPIVMSVSAFFTSLFIGLFIALIVAGFLKREAVEPPAGV